MEKLSFNLRRQLIVVSVLLLSLPWAGCQFIREMESALGAAQEQALLATAKTVAAMTAERPALLYTDPTRLDAAPDSRLSVYAQPAKQTVVVDGYAEGWEDIPTTRWKSSSTGSELAVSTQAITLNGKLYLLLSVRDEEVIYQNPGLSSEPNGDRLILQTWLHGQSQVYALATEAPGRMQARAAGRRDGGVDAERIWGFWQDARGGYTLEVEIPLELTGERLGFYIIDSNTGAKSPAETLGNIDPLDDRAPPWLVRTPDALPLALSPFRAQADSVQLLDRDGWIVGDLSASAPTAGTAETFWLLRMLYRSILSSTVLEEPPEPNLDGQLGEQEAASALAGELSSGRYRDPDSSNRTLRLVAAPVHFQNEVIGAVVARQSSEQYLSLTDQAFSRLLGYSALAIGIGVLGLLAYASLLSLRIGRLSKAAGNIVSSDGAISGNFPRSNAPDEIGELSRRYAELLDRLREYNDYLRTLSRKLAHELRTPIAVIQTSLDNLEETNTNPDKDSPYLSRAREGLSRLDSILQSMSEANRLEESLTQNSLGEMDLLPILQELHGAYSAIYPSNPIELLATGKPARVVAAPDLIVQLLDKLVDNAVSFSLPSAPVVLSLEGDGAHWILAVSNSGPPLPDDIQSTLFDPMVSSRAADDGQLHLGLGLHIARLICDYLGATLVASNTVEPPGVRITVTLPAQ